MSTPAPHGAPRPEPAAGPDPAEPQQQAPEPAPPTAPAPRAVPVGRAALRAALVPRATRAQLATGALCLVLGLALVTTVRERSSADLSSLRQSDLISLLDTTAARADQLQREAAELERTRAELAGASGASRAAREVARERLGVLEILAGTSPATGPGIVLSVSGPGVDADLLLSAVQELRDAGAEAIQVGGVRVVASTYLEQSGTSVVVDGAAISAPYTFVAIGDPATLASAMSFPGGVLPTVSARGGTAQVEQRDRVEVTALRRDAPAPGAGTGEGSR